MEHVSELITTMPVSSNAPTLFESPSLVGEQGEKESKISSLEDKGQ